MFLVFRTLVPIINNYYIQIKNKKIYIHITAINNNLCLKNIFSHYFYYILCT